MKHSNKRSTVLLSILLTATFSAVAQQDIPIIKYPPSKPYEILGQLRHWECKKSLSDTQAKLEQQALQFLKAEGTASRKSFTKEVNAITNVACDYRTDAKMIAGCDKALFCEADMIHWK